MDAQTVIESYVRDVTQQLRRKDRSDVALELRALLTEELAARAAGAPADEAMAIELVRSFGAPSEVAARYRPATPLLDAADTRPFIIAAILGALPLVIASGDGSELRRPLGVSIIGGLVISQILTLYTTPVIYLYLDRLRLWAEPRNGAKGWKAFRSFTRFGRRRIAPARNLQAPIEHS